MPALKLPVKKVTVEDAVIQTDPIPGLKPLEKSKPINTSEDKKDSLAPDPFIFIFSYLFFFFFLKGHNTCIAYRSFVYLSPLARKKGSGNK